MVKLILLVVYICSLITVIFIERKRPTEALLWTFVMICLPYFGTVLYFVFGNTTTIKMTAAIRKKRLKKMNKKEPIPHVISHHCEISQADQQVMHFNAFYNESPVTCYDDIQIYTDGQHHYEQLFEDIHNAKESIMIEFYTIHHDCMGEALVEALTKKAKEGLKVMVLCDFIANLSTPQKMYRPLLEAGGQVIRIKPYFTHYRSHRKIVVIDQCIGYIGGMNIGKQYANMHKVKTPWRDTQVRLEGACVEILMQYFLTDWMCALTRRYWDCSMDYIMQMENKDYHHTDHLCQFVVGGVDNNKESVKMVYMSMIRAAQSKINIQSPYFIPDASLLDALKTALCAGVEVNIMIPGIKASFFLDPVTRYYCGELLKYGAHIYKYHGYIHAKTMTIDEDLCAIGSVNMDIRSLMVDDEICGIFYDNPFVENYVSLYQKDIEHCDVYTLEEYQNRSQMDKMKEGFYLLFAPLM